MDLTVLLLRLVLGAILVMHATQKTLGWFGGAGLEVMAGVFEGLGQRPGRTMVIVASTMELAGALLLVAGLATPLGGAIAAGTMIVAGATLSIAKRTFWNAGGGGEYPFVLAATAIVVASSGGGAFSLDHVLGAPWTDPTASAAALTAALTLLVAAAAAARPVVRTRKALSTTEP